MIHEFKSNRASNTRYVIGQLVFGILIFAAFLYYMIIIRSRPANDPYYYLLGLLVIIISVSLIYKTRISKIEFDTERRQIIFHFSRVFSEAKVKTLTFENARLEVDNKTGWRGDNFIIYFLGKKTELFKIDKSKDGFSSQAIQDSRDTASRLGLPISKY